MPEECAWVGCKRAGRHELCFAGRRLGAYCDEHADFVKLFVDSGFPWNDKVNKK